ncbi:MAG TPA: S8 family serine peptidase, partial [Anaerolineae bacterium]|nr:S8 family serine peptidase [Anaerolineae bacterium]
VEALRAAGIVPVFAAGNHGPATATIGSPASYPESIAVGATDDLDVVASFSSRGPSAWGEIKPEVSAPGTSIRSSLPGGTYGTYRGTSMASPHVAGAAALLLQADPSLTVAEIEAIFASTAEPLGMASPNNDTGWGRLDAYRAAAVAMQAGFLTGTVSSGDGSALPAARVTAYDHEGLVQGTVQAGETGRYWLALPPGAYDVTAEAFGHEPGTVAGVAVQQDVTRPLDLILVPLPAGTVRGSVRDEQTGAPVAARIWAVDTPVETVSDPRTGAYSLSLPAGSYAIRAALNGYRLQTVPDVAVTSGQASPLSLSLVPAPTLLLLDSGAWYYGSKVRYFQEALDDAGYVYDTWQVRNPAIDAPDLASLAPYEITVWSAPLDSPGLIGAADVISGYLSSGGKVFLTGQDVGYWDGGLDITGGREYFRLFLKAVATVDDAGRNDLAGLPGELLDGLTLALNGPDSARNQIFPDAISLLDTRDAALLGRYVDDGDAALRCSGCQSYRAVYLAAGLEGLGTRAERAEVLARSLAWLATPDPTTAVDLNPPRQEQVRLGSATAVSYTVELRNSGATADRFALELGPSAWQTSLWDAHLAVPVTESLELSPCHTQTLLVRVDIPAGVTWNAGDVVTLTARSANEPAQTAQAGFRTKAPAPILLVDDHVFYDSSGKYLAALEAGGLPYDYWRAGHSPILGLSSPSLERLESYRIVIWFTAYDWYSPLAPSDEVRLAAYLRDGGRLLLSSQDYLLSGDRDFAETYLGVANYTESLSSTAVAGAMGSPVGAGMEQRALSYPFRNWSDALHATGEARPAFWGQHGQPPALILARAPWKTAFFAFALEALDAGSLAEVIYRTTGWLSPLGDSTLAVDRAGAAEGEQLRYELLIRNTGPLRLQNVALHNPVPLHTAYVAGSVEGPATYDASTNRFTWAGALAPGQMVAIRYRLQLDGSVLDGTVITNTAELREESGLVVERTATTRIDAPNLSSSTLTSSLLNPTASLPMAYTFTLHNDGPRVAQATLLDPVPERVSYTPGTAWASSGTISDTAKIVSWTGSIGPGEKVTVHLPVVLEPSAAAHYLLNRAILNDGLGGSTTLEAYTWVQVRLFLPVLFKRE